MGWVFSRRACLIAAAGIASRRSWAADGPLVIGQSAPVTGYGPQAAAALNAGIAQATRELNDGLAMCFEQVNRAGGIAGRPLALRTLDDAYDTKRTVSNTQALIDDPAVIALTAYRGTPNIEASFAAIEQGGIALIGPQSGAASMYDKNRRLVFPSRASYRAEVEKIVSHGTTVGFQRIAVLYTDSAFGLDARDAARASLASRQMTPVKEFGLSRQADDVMPALEAIASARPQMVLIASAAVPAAAFVKAAVQRIPGCEFYALSNVSQASFAEAIAATGRATVVAQVFPHRGSATPLMQEFRREAARTGRDTGSYAVIEGYVTGRLVAAALRLAGPKPTRATVAKALVGQRIDLGGLSFDYPAGGYVGSRFVELTLVTREGRFVR